MTSIVSFTGLTTRKWRSSRRATTTTTAT